MKKIILLAIVAVFATMSSFSQNDTIVKYYGKAGKEAPKDSAISFVKFYRQSGMWHGMEYDIKKNTLKSEGDYSEANTAAAVGGVNYFNPDGKLYYTIEYADGKPIERTYFYKSGNKMSYTMYGENGRQISKAWDDNGKELKNFVMERDPQFKGGEDGWKKYLDKNLNATIPTALGLPVGNYEVQLQFVVAKDGIPANVKVVSAPAKCKACATEALRIMKESPAWESAILNNSPIDFEATKTITFEPVKKG
ncbi:MAG TPA: hypothetical protein VF623_04660 [Segetibacter sp.]|jgi:hypothetical protein